MKRIVLMAVAIVLLHCNIGLCANLHRAAGVVTDIVELGHGITIALTSAENKITIIDHIQNAEETRGVFEESLRNGSLITIIFKKSWSISWPKNGNNSNAIPINLNETRVYIESIRIGNTFHGFQ